MNDLIYDAYSIFFQLAELCAPDFLGSLEIAVTVLIFSGVFLLVVTIGLLAILHCVARALLKLGVSE